MRPLHDTTYITDASSQSQTAAVIWKTGGRWEKRMWTQTNKSVQWLEAKAVQMALQQEAENPVNIVTDSLYVYKLVHKMTTVGFVQTEVSTLLYEALQQRIGQAFITHVNGHQSLPGPIEKAIIRLTKRHGVCGHWTPQRVYMPFYTLEQKP